MKQLCFLLLCMNIFSNSLKITLKTPLMPGYNENYAYFAESFISRPHSIKIVNLSKQFIFRRIKWRS